MRLVTALAFVIAFAAPAFVSATSNQGTTANYPVVPVLPVDDRSAHGTFAPAIQTLGQPDFCWELALDTRTQPLFAYLRRKVSGRIVATIDTRDNHMPLMPWPGSERFSGCIAISRADARAFLHAPSSFYLDVRTKSARHAATAHPHGPKL